jgi:hypothetical protein
MEQWGNQAQLCIETRLTQPLQSIVMPQETRNGRTGGKCMCTRGQTCYALLPPGKPPITLRHHDGSAAARNLQVVQMNLNHCSRARNGEQAPDNCPWTEIKKPHCVHGLLGFWRSRELCYDLSQGAASAWIRTEVARKLFWKA